MGTVGLLFDSSSGIENSPQILDISFVKASRREVHVFSDASKDAIASVAYLKLFFDELYY
jgi:hypothetical protein